MTVAPPLSLPGAGTSCHTPGNNTKSSKPACDLKSTVGRRTWWENQQYLRAFAKQPRQAKSPKELTAGQGVGQGQCIRLVPGRGFYPQRGNKQTLGKEKHKPQATAIHKN